MFQRLKYFTDNSDNFDSGFCVPHNSGATNKVSNKLKSRFDESHVTLYLEWDNSIKLATNCLKY